ncbi:MAG: hypothetical protein ACJZ3C_04540 [Pelagibacteraceae bacterium]
MTLILFPSGTIMSSGPSCTEQGSGRWLPKPSDTLNKFALMLDPDVGFKQIPLIWYEDDWTSVRLLALFFLIGLPI